MGGITSARTPEELRELEQLTQVWERLPKGGFVWTVRPPPMARVGDHFQVQVAVYPPGVKVPPTAISSDEAARAGTRADVTRPVLEAKPVRLTGKMGATLHGQGFRVSNEAEVVQSVVASEETVWPAWEVEVLDAGHLTLSVEMRAYFGEGGSRVYSQSYSMDVQVPLWRRLGGGVAWLWSAVNGAVSVPLGAALFGALTTLWRRRHRQREA